VLRAPGTFLAVLDEHYDDTDYHGCRDEIIGYQM